MNGTGALKKESPESPLPLPPQEDRGKMAINELGSGLLPDTKPTMILDFLPPKL